MKQSVFLRYFLILVSFILLVCLFACNTGEDISNEYSTYIFENKTDSKSYFVKLDSINKSYAKGRFYLIDNGLTLRPRIFEAVLHKNKCKLTLPNDDVVTFKIKSQSDNKYEGFILSHGFSKRKKFSLYPYLSDEKQTFNLNRYKQKLFDVERITNVEYAEAKGFWTSIPDDTIDVGSIVKIGLFNSLKKKDLVLDMDIYIPKDDTLSQRPLMMFIHGGAFFIGDKATEPYQRWCTHFASLGYVCVSINYRMGFRVNSKAIERTAYQATQDAHAAMRFLLSKKDIYRIDPDNLFVGGASAGSITAMNLTYMRNENRPESSYSSLF